VLATSEHQRGFAGNILHTIITSASGRQFVKLDAQNSCIQKTKISAKPYA